MDIQEIRKVKKETESKIHDVVAKILHEFKKQTGESPRNVYICLVPIVRMGTSTYEAIIADVDIQIDL